MLRPAPTPPMIDLQQFGRTLTAEGYTPDRARRCVERGAAWLDAARPGWRRRVSAERLRMGDPARCVLGQVFAAPGQSGFARGLEALAADAGVAARDLGALAAWYGFELPDPSAPFAPTTGVERLLVMLDLAWLSVLRRRLR
jgi:hypothetical protein